MRLIQILSLMFLASCAHLTSLPVVVTQAQAQDAAREALGALYLSPAPPVTVRVADESWVQRGVSDQVSGTFRCTRTACRIDVTADESDLAHEMLHYFEYQTTGNANALHTGWSAKGYEEKIYRYQDMIGVAHNRGY